MNEVPDFDEKLPKGQWYARCGTHRTYAVVGNATDAKELADFHISVSPLCTNVLFGNSLQSFISFKDVYTRVSPQQF